MNPDIPVSKWIPIMIPQEKAQEGQSEDVVSKPEIDSDLIYFGDKLRDYLGSLIKTGHGRYEDLSDHDTLSLRVLSLMNRVRPILETGYQPAEVLKALMRNKKIIQTNEHPIKKGSHLHGLDIDYLDNSHNGIVASELYNGEKSTNILPLRVYTSYVTNDDASHGLNKLVEATHTGAYGMKSGTVTLIFASDGRLGPPKTTYMASKPNSEAIAIPLGVPSTEITGCIVFNQEDEQKTIDKISKFPFPIPVYNSVGRMIYPK